MSDSVSQTSWNLLESQPHWTAAPQALWRSIFLFNVYRLILGGLLVTFASYFSSALSEIPRHQTIFLYTSLIYLVLTLAAFVTIKLRSPRFNWQLSILVSTDIICVTILSHVSGGMQDSMGLLLFVSLAAAGMVSRGKITLFFAALASIATLLQHSYEILTQDAAATQYLQTGMLSATYFAIAWLAHVLAKYAIASEKLAARRGVDLANMAEVNRLVIQDMPDGVLVIDELGIIRQHNPSAERLLGRHFQNVQEVTLEECAPELAGRLALWRDDPSRQYEPLTLTNLPYQTQARFLSVQSEAFWGAVVFLEDMQRVQAQAQQIKLAALGRLTANIAHEVRNPLSAISYATELLREEKHDPEQTRLFEVILENTTRLNNIVRDVMQLNRRDRAQREKINLADKLRSFVESIRLTENVAEGIFLFKIVPDWQINFDRGHLDQVLWNLFRNALRYCQRQPGSVHLQAWRGDKGQVILDIINDGPIVSPDVLQKLFEPFFTTATGGTGLGLYIARELCDANGAKLEYREAGLKTCFRIQFADPNELSFQ